MLSLLAPWFLAGLGALAVPVLVHLTHKERKEVVPFPSLMFLTRIPYQAVRRQRLRHLLLFALRCLAILLLVLAFARPFLKGPKGPLGAGGLGNGRDIVILLDRSYSMEYGDHWQRAQAAANAAIGRMGGADRAAVVYFAGTAWSAADLTHDKAALRAAVDSATPTAGGTRYDAAFRLAQRVFGDTARPRREIVLISDYQRAGWGGRELPPLTEGTTLTQIPISDSVSANIAVIDADVRYDSSTTRDRIVVAARLMNRGTEPVVKRSVTLEINGREMQTKLVDLPAHGVATAQFDALPLPAGQARGTVRTENDSLERDNRFHFVVQRRPSLPVVLVQPSDAGPETGLFITRALSIGRHPSFRVAPVRATQLSATTLRTAALVILNGVPVPEGAIGPQLVEYVKGGGGLLVVLGSRGDANQWPAVADELLPRPDAPVDRVADRGATFGFVDRGHKVFEAFNAPRSGDFSAARFLRYAALDPAAGDRELARFGDGRVALLERRVGTGRVLVWSSDLDGFWNDLPLQPVFLPFLHQVAKYAAGYQNERPWGVVGEVVSPSTVPGDSTPYVAIAPTRTQIRFGVPDAPPALELAEQGFYEIKPTSGSAGAERTLAVNVDVAESDLAPIDTALFATAVAPRAVEPGQTKATGTPGELKPQDLEARQNVWWYLLMALLLLLAAETLLSNRLSRAAR